MNFADRAVNDTPLETMKRLFVEAGMSHDIADGYVDLIRREFAGELIYIASSAWTDSRSRNLRIKQERSSGRSLGWLAAQFCLSRTRVWEIVNDRAKR